MSLAADTLQSLRGQLQQRAQALGRELREVDADRNAALGRGGTDPVEDSGERGEQRSRDAVRDAEQQRDAAELAGIKAALERMDQQRYGECVDCGRDIPPARLQAQPTALRCVPCQQRFEKTHDTAPRAAPLG